MLGPLEGYVPFVLFAGLFLIVGLGMVVGSKLLPKILGVRKGDATRVEPYECGVDPIQPDARERFSVPFYLVAILFILFDLETVFLFPWATTFRDMQYGPGKVLLLVEVMAFVFVLAAGLFYVWKRRGLEWE